jgi:Polyketide cyclase / dehydrase and lipid transport
MADKSEVTVKDTIAAPIEDVWKLAADFGGIADIMDGIESIEVEGEGVGMLRKMPGRGGEFVVERLEALDPDRHHVAYSIVEGPLPFRDYYATIDLAADGDGTAIEWTGRFEPDGVPTEKAERLANGVYTAGIAGFKKALGVD